MSQTHWSLQQPGRRIVPSYIRDPKRCVTPYKQGIKSAAMAEFHKLTGGSNECVRTSWTQAKFKRITKLMRYSHRAEGIWS